MSISVNGVTRTASIAPATADVRASALAPAPTAKSSIDTTPAAGQPAPPLRFPWLSRLTAELEPVAKQKSAFPTAPALGENIDQDA